MYKYVIWDFDGTIFDTYPHSTQIYYEELKKEGIEESTDKINSLSRVSLGVLHEYLKSKYGVDDEFCKRCGEVNRADEPGKVFPYPGAYEICEKIKNSGGENWLYTHRGVSAKDLLRDADMIKFFSDFVIDGDGFPYKPAPDAINALISRNGINKTEAIMVGDREIDCGSGCNAGIDSCLFMPFGVEETSATYTAYTFGELEEIIFGKKED